VVDITGTIAVLSSLLGIPLIVFGFIYMNGRGKREIELSRLRNEAARLELEKERVHLLLLQAENAKYDRLIEERVDAKPRKDELESQIASLSQGEARGNR